MPHISLKILNALTDEQKKDTANKLADALCEAIECSPDHISVSIEEYTLAEAGAQHSSITLKMLEGRSDEQKQLAAQKLADTFYRETGLIDTVNVAVADFTPEEWQDVYAEEIAGKKDTIFREANYDPKDLLK